MALTILSVDCLRSHIANAWNIVRQILETCVDCARHVKYVSMFDHNMGLRNLIYILLLLCLCVTYRTNIFIKKTRLTLQNRGVYVGCGLFHATPSIRFRLNSCFWFLSLLRDSRNATGLHCVSLRCTPHFLLRFEWHHRFLRLSFKCNVCYCILSIATRFHVILPEWCLSWEIICILHCLWTWSRLCLRPAPALVWLQRFWSLSQIAWRSSCEMRVLVHIICFYLLSNSSCLLERDLTLSHVETFRLLFCFWHFQSCTTWSVFHATEWCNCTTFDVSWIWMLQIGLL